ncbi:hypothetical protein LPB140_06790 [Sphingorhabdus lutea]|uniref:YnbE-like lipoprotein n=2 Tax=Sphingorhabdus lutea TaxID=1913578 RepID=A0A1L3JEW3_9SPHN|nr:hypothetical protein LPB140_06790 [Sphingorhabdus lutea]
MRDSVLRNVKITFLSISLLSLTNCVQIAAPDKPIVIELNIKIEQSVVLRIDGAVKQAIEENAGIF